MAIGTESQTIYSPIVAFVRENAAFFSDIPQLYRSVETSGG